MTITLPDALREELVTKARAGGFATVDEYVVDVVTKELEIPDELPDVANPNLTPRNRAELEAMLEEGLNSGPPVVVDAEFWAERRRVLRQNMVRKPESKP